MARVTSETEAASGPRTPAAIHGAFISAPHGNERICTCTQLRVWCHSSAHCQAKSVRLEQKEIVCAPCGPQAGGLRDLTRCLTSQCGDHTPAPVHSSEPAAWGGGKAMCAVPCSAPQSHAAPLSPAQRPSVCAPCLP